MMRTQQVKFTMLITIIMVFVLLSMLCSVSEARRLSNDFGSNNNDLSLSHYPAVYESAKNRLAFWLQKLASGPGGGGAGH